MWRRTRADGGRERKRERGRVTRWGRVRAWLLLEKEKRQRKKRRGRTRKNTVSNTSHLHHFCSLWKRTWKRERLILPFSPLCFSLRERGSPVSLESKHPRAGRTQPQLLRASSSSSSFFIPFREKRINHCRKSRCLESLPRRSATSLLRPGPAAAGRSSSMSSLR